MNSTEVPCRHAEGGCRAAASVVVYCPGGCSCWPDPVQAVCPQHWLTMDSTGPMLVVAELTEEALTRREDKGVTVEGQVTCYFHNSELARRWLAGEKGLQQQLRELFTGIEEDKDMNEERQFPLMWDNTDKDPPRTIPWSLAEKAYVIYARDHGGSGQTLERVAERGGFYIKEMDTFLPGWRDRIKKETGA